MEFQASNYIVALTNPPLAVCKQCQHANIDADIQAKAFFWLIIFAFVFTRYGLQRIFVSTYNPSTLIARSGWTETVPSLTVAVRFTFFGFLVRCTRSYFAGANVALYIAAYLAHSRCAFSRIWQFLSVDLL